MTFIPPAHSGSWVSFLERPWVAEAGLLVAALGWAAAVAFAATRRRSWGVRTAAALAVSTFYLGALVLSYFVIDVATWRITW